MGCQEFAGGVICSGPRDVVRRYVMRCWNCQTNRRVVSVWQGVFYGSIQYCCHCGDGWGGGERLERPFMRGWRQKAIAQARKYWDEALTPREYDKAIDAELKAYFGPDGAEC
jgi:hypothetical protein